MLPATAPIGEGFANVLLDMTYADLADAGVMHLNWTARPDFIRRFNQRIRGEPVRWHENDITRVMTNSTGLLEQALTRALCQAGDVHWMKAFRLVSGTDLNRQSTPTRNLIADRRGATSIDLVVVDYLRGDRPTVHLGAEVKLGASTNGGYGYCQSKRHGVNCGHYSNQLICYPSACSHPLLDHEDGVAFVWLAHEDATNARGRLTQRDRHLDGAFSEQQQIQDLWKWLSWHDLDSAVKGALSDSPAEVQTALSRVLQPLKSKTPIPKVMLDARGPSCTKIS